MPDVELLPPPPKKTTANVDGELLPPPPKKKDLPVYGNGSYPSSSLLISAGGNIGVDKGEPELASKSLTKPFADIFSSYTLLDQDIASNSANTLSNFNASQGGDLTKFNRQQNSIAGGGIAPSNEEQYVAQKTEIKRNPDALKEYRIKRTTELDEQKNSIPNIEIEQASGLITASPEDMLAAEANVIAKNNIETYKTDLKKSIADAAVISVPQSFFSTNTNFTIEDVGKKFLDVIGDATIHEDIKFLNTTPTDLNPKRQTSTGQLGEFLRPGSTEKDLSNQQSEIDNTKQLIKNRLFKEGSAVLSAYQAKVSNDIEFANPEKISAYKKAVEDKDTAAINLMLQDPVIKEYSDAVTETLHYANEAETSEKYYPQAARNKLRQELNEKFFKLVTARDAVGNQVTPLYSIPQAIFGETPTDDEIKQLAKEVGKTESEVRSIVEGGAKGLFASAPEGVRVSGGLSGISQGVDETLANTVMGLRRIFDADNVAAKNRLTQSKVDAYNMSASQNKLYDDLGNLNFNPASIFNMAGRGMGQMSIYAAPTLLTGGLAEGLVAPELLSAANAGKTAVAVNAIPKTVEGLTTLATGYISSYEPAYREIASFTDNEEVRNSYARFVAMANAAPELMLSPAAMVKKFGLGSASKESLIKSFVKDAENLGAEKAFWRRTVQGVGQAAKVGGAEITEELTTNVASNVADEIYMNKVRDAAQLSDQFWQTAVSTLVSMAPIAIGAGIGGFNDQSNIRKHGYFEAGNNSELVKAEAKRQYQAGLMNEQKYNSTLSIVNTMENIVNNLPKTNINGEPLTYDQKASLSAQQYRINLNNKIKENLSKGNGVAAQEPLLEKDTQEAIAAQTEILTAPIIPISNEQEAKDEGSNLDASNVGAEPGTAQSIDPASEENGVAENMPTVEPASEVVSSVSSKGNEDVKGLNNVESFETSKGSKYVVGDYGKTARFKTKTGEQKEPQDLTVFVKLEGQSEDDILQALHNPKAGEIISVVDKDGNVVKTNEDAVGKDLYLSVYDYKNNKRILSLPVTNTPTVGHSVFDVSYDKNSKATDPRYKVAHLGNEVVNINFKNIKNETKRNGAETDPNVLSKPGSEGIEQQQRDNSGAPTSSNVRVGANDTSKGNLRKGDTDSPKSNENGRGITSGLGKPNNEQTVERSVATKEPQSTNADQQKTNSEVDNGSVSKGDINDAIILEATKDFNTIEKSINGRLNNSSLSKEEALREYLDRYPPKDKKFNSRYDELKSIVENKIAKPKEIQQLSNNETAKTKTEKPNEKTDAGSNAQPKIINTGLQGSNVEAAPIAAETNKPAKDGVIGEGKETTDSKVADQIPEKSVAEKGKELADRIRSLRPKTNTAQATIFGLPIAIYDTAIVTIANAVEASANLAEATIDLAGAIQKGISYIQTQVKDWQDKDGKFEQHINDFIEGKKPKITAQTTDEDVANNGTVPPVDDNAGKGEDKDKPKMRSVYKNVIERSKLTPKQKKSLADDPVAMYYELPNDKAKQIALEVIQEMGVENAVAEASRRNSDLEPFEKVMILGAAMDYYAGLAKAAEKSGIKKDVSNNSDLEIDVQDKMLQVTQELAKLGTSLGRGINMFNEVYKLSNIALERKLKKQVAELNKLLNPQVDAAVEVVKDILEDNSVTGIGESMTDADAQQAADMKNKVAALEKEIEDLKKQVAANANAPKGSKKNPLNITRQTNTTDYDKRLKEFTQRHRTGISNEDLSDLGYFGLYHIENGLTKFADWFDTMNRKFSKFKEHFKETYLGAKDRAIENGAEPSLFDNEDIIDTHLDELRSQSDALKMAQLTKRKAIAEFNNVMENNPDRARIQAPRIAAERVRKDAERNLGLITTKNEQNYLKRLVSVVQAKAREYYKEKKENISNINDILAFAIANGKADYQIWERTQAEVESQIDADEKLSDEDKAEVKDFLKDYTDSIFETLLTNNQQEEIIRQKLIEAGYSTERIINGKVVNAVDWSKVIASAKNIKEAKDAIRKAILSVGFTEAEARNEIDAVLNQFDNKVVEKKQAAINSYLKKGIINKVKGALGNNKTKIQKLVDMNNKGILDDTRVKDVLANDLGIISLTDDDLKRVRELSELIDNSKIPAFQRKKYEEQLQYLFDSKGGNLTYLEFREFLANNRLTSVYNNIQNLTGWFRGISTYITVAVKTGSPLQAAKIAKRAFKESISDALTILLNGDVSRGTSFSDLTRSTEGEPRVRYLEQGKGKLLGLPDAYVRLGKKIFNLNVANTAYRGIKYVARVLESADTVPSNVISGLTQYWQIRKQLQFLHPEWSNQQVESKTYETMYSVGLAEASKEAMDGFNEAGITPSKYQLNRAVHEINERKRNETLSKEFYDTVEQTKPEAEKRLKDKGTQNPTSEEITNEAYLILGRDEPLDVVARGERQSLRETGKKSTYGLAGLILLPINATNERIKKSMLSNHTNKERWFVNLQDSALTYLLPFANSIGRWIEMGIELTPYGVLKGLAYKGGLANSFEELKEGKITKQELSELGDDYIIRGVQGSAMLVAAMYFMYLLNGDDDDDEKVIDVTGTYKNPSYPKEKIQSVGNPDQTLTVKGYKIPLGLMGNAAYPLIMYKDFLDRRTEENEKHGILYTTAAVYLVTSAQSVSSRLGGYGSIIGGFQSGKEERYMPQLGKIAGSNVAASTIPFNRLQQEVSQLWNPKSEQSLTFGENLLQQFSIVGALGKEHPSFDYRGREYDFGEIFTGSADGIVKMFEKSKRADKIDRKLAELDFGATDAFRESKDEENYKYTIVNQDGTSRFMTVPEYYDFRKTTSQKFNEKLVKNFEIVDNLTITLDGKTTDEKETQKVMNEAYSNMLTTSKEQALDLVQAKTGFMPSRTQEERLDKKENKIILKQKKRQLRGLVLE